MTSALVIQLFLSLLDRASAIGKLFEKSVAEGRDLNIEEVKSARDFYRAALNNLDASIEKAELEQAIKLSK